MHSRSLDDSKRAVKACFAIVFDKCNHIEQTKLHIDRKKGGVPLDRHIVVHTAKLPMSIFVDFDITLDLT